MPDAPHPPTLGLVLAGGRAHRMGGGDKALIAIGGVAILDRVLALLRPACADIILNANGDPARFARYRLPVVPDGVPGFAGPLAGVLAGLDWAAANRPDLAWVVSVPGDCPFLPHDLVERLHRARENAGTPLACARSGDWRHPVAALWPLGLRDDLRHALVVEDQRRIEVWTARHGVAIADWPAQPLDPFFNVNTPEDAAEAERLAQLCLRAGEPTAQSAAVQAGKSEHDNPAQAAKPVGKRRQIARRLLFALMSPSPPSPPAPAVAPPPPRSGRR